MIKDVNILLSVINTALRDKYSSLDDFFDNTDYDYTETISFLNDNGYYYDKNTNSFKLKV